MGPQQMVKRATMTTTILEILLLMEIVLSESRWTWNKQGFDMIIAGKWVGFVILQKQNNWSMIF